MVRWRGGSAVRMNQAPPNLRVQMIHETSVFLSWALSTPRAMPRIPRRRVDEGGFAALLKRPGARALVDRWWARVLR